MKKKSQYNLALEQVQAQSNTPTTTHLSEAVTVEQQDSETVNQPTVQTARQLDKKPAKQQRIKATFYLSPADIIAIDKMQTAKFEKNGKKPEKSELVSEAIQLLFKQLDS